jgi:hypothetical protein
MIVDVNTQAEISNGDADSKHNDKSSQREKNSAQSGNLASDDKPNEQKRGCDAQNDQSEEDAMHLTRIKLQFVIYFLPSRGKTG